jgi:hypothetical protein
MDQLGTLSPRSTPLYVCLLQLTADQFSIPLSPMTQYLKTDYHTYALSKAQQPLAQHHSTNVWINPQQPTIVYNQYNDGAQQPSRHIL